MGEFAHWLGGFWTLVTVLSRLSGLCLRFLGKCSARGQEMSLSLAMSYRSSWGSQAVPRPKRYIYILYITPVAYSGCVSWSPLSWTYPESRIPSLLDPRTAERGAFTTSLKTVSISSITTSPGGTSNKRRPQYGFHLTQNFTNQSILPSWNLDPNWNQPLEPFRSRQSNLKVLDLYWSHSCV